MKLTYDNLTQDLLTMFPALENIYLEECEYVYDIQHLVFEIIFVPYIIQSCECFDDEEIEKICSFMEDMEVCEDENVENVLAVSVLEPLLNERSVAKLLKKYLKPHTLELFSLQEKDYGYRV
jgi:hypothetical protein